MMIYVYDKVGIIMTDQVSNSITMMQYKHSETQIVTGILHDSRDSAHISRWHHSHGDIRVEDSSTIQLWNYGTEAVRCIVV